MVGEPRMNMSQLGVTLIFMGFILIFIAMILWIFLSSGWRMRGGGIIMIGPLPLIFGRDKESVKLLLILAIILMLMMIALTFIPMALWRSPP